VSRIRIGLAAAALTAFGVLGTASPAFASTCNDNFLGDDVQNEGFACELVLDTVNRACTKIGGGPCFG
jgi:hypothetical protein